MELYEHHPLTAIFAPLDGNALTCLADDVRANGLRDPITLYEGKILDGRSRQRACQLTGVEPEFIDFVQPYEAALEYLVTKNLSTRSFTPAQRAALAVDLIPWLENDWLTGEAVLAKAAELAGSAPSTVKKTLQIQQRDPNAVNQMRAGNWNISRAARSVGYVGITGHEGDAPINDEGPQVYFGKGDKWREAYLPIERYLRGWEKRDYKFTHVNPREAGKRVKIIDSLIAELTAARADLADRAHLPRMRS